MKDVLALKKVSPALRLCIESTWLSLWIKDPDLTEETFRSYLLDRPDEVLAQFESLTPQEVSQSSHEQLFCLMEDADYDSALAARESESGLFLDLHKILTELRDKMEDEHKENKRLSPTANYMIAVDGSRQSYLAFELAARLRRQGRLSIINIDDELADSRQLPQISSEFITEEYEAHCSRLQLPLNRVTIRCERSDSSGKISLAQQLLRIAERDQIDFLVIGAYGKGGPTIDQVCHVPWEVLRSSISTPTLIVSPAPVNSLISKQYVFVVAVDKSAAAMRCINAALKLMRPVDILRVVHFHEPPIVGEYDAQPFEQYHNIIEKAQINGAVDIQAVEGTNTIAESLQLYLSVHGAAYLVLGLNGEGAERKGQVYTIQEPIEAHPSEQINSIGRLASAMLFSPRCALCLCP